MSKKAASDLVTRHHAWLFQATFPASRAEYDAAEAGLRGLAADLAARPADDALKGALENSGIAGTAVASTFTLAAVRWLCERFGAAVQLAYLDADPSEIMAVLHPALDPMERDALADRPLPWRRWQRKHLGPDVDAHLRRLVALVSRLPGDGVVQEAAWARLQVFVRWHMAADAPGLTQGRFGRAAPFVHEAGFWRPADPSEVFALPRPRRVRLTPADRHHLVDLGRGVMLSLLRETDFFTYADAQQIECFDLGRGMRVALYASIGERKLTLESYIGYLLFKNGVPVAYGGSWILGAQAAFGVNVLPPYRGGESTLIVCQLLRLYAWRFGLQQVRVEASQIGRANHDGIQSGSFWFYWRLGFRPLQPELTALAEADWARIMAESQGRPSARHYRPQVLKRLASAVLVWRTPAPGTWRYVDPVRLGERVSAHVLERFDGDRDAAHRAACRALGGRPGPALQRLALVLAALTPADGWSADERRALRAMGALKAGDEPAFNQALRRHRRLVAALQALG